MISAVFPLFWAIFFPNALDLYWERNPGTTFNVFHEMSISVAEGVSAGTFDLGFCSMVEKKDDLVFIPITYQELIVIVQKEHPLACKDSIQLSDLKDYTLTTYRDTIPIGKTIRVLLKEKGVDAAYSYDDEISIAGRISKSGRAAIVADTPFLKQFDNLKKIRLTDVPKDYPHDLHGLQQKELYHLRCGGVCEISLVANCLNLPQ